MKHFFKSISLFTLFMSCFYNGAVNAQAGNVGIGTTTPGSRLTVNGSFATVLCAGC